MIRSFSTWFLAGALAASLTWNWRLAHPSAEATAEGTAPCVPLDTTSLGLAPEQEGALDALCSGACLLADRLESQADQEQRGLMERLARGELDEREAQRLTTQIGDLRRRSLEECVRGIFGVRKILTPEQVAGLVTQCAADGSCPK
jgi:Spy/CpxP family protein refolding chaperone